MECLLKTPSLLGSERNGSLSHNYCIYCYRNGAFEQPGITIDEMIEKCILFMVAEGFDKEEARQMLSEFLLGLRRWRSH
ncbi:MULTISPECIES: zinc ribbon domain-containing protein [Aminobacterium]|uniref:zinc ribbon domain-containing protein n=1 Tax=Aminobacterium TaxID=81466 RepID=UPI00030D3B8D|nr:MULTISPECIES: zinc ribbon domain-containing protein [Aminobacterium]MDD2379374.1 zinc ribbon domain-containing protein [Aminobacterium colombiense]MDD3767926.1 zinc ribbon domain-containing protein [Aminobacterium colombiense]MDD4265515.1 zinc ribbon domain-containing protein [Aminobacterium colombiense]MDD4585558.1 zinc ribbon domain-containing protein [Aminobacterium colombiense]NLK30338.1 transcriptional regulator [Aminobacterium colombiense]